MKGNIVFSFLALSASINAQQLTASSLSSSSPTTTVSLGTGTSDSRYVPLGTGVSLSRSSSSSSNSASSISASSSSSSSSLETSAASTILSTTQTGSSDGPRSSSTSKPGGPGAPPNSITTTSGGFPPFVIPTVTSTIEFSMTLIAPPPKPTSDGTPVGGYTVSNPSNPTEIVGFAKTNLPSSHQNDYPDASDLAPLALLGLLFLRAPLTLPSLLFGGGIVVFPFASEVILTGAATWLTLDMFPKPDMLDDSTPDDPDDPQDPDDPDDHPSTSERPNKPTTSKSTSSKTTSAPSSSSAGKSIPTITETIKITLSSIQGEFAAPNATYMTVDQGFIWTTLDDTDDDISTSGSSSISSSSASSSASLASSSVSSSNLITISSTSSSSQSTSTPIIRSLGPDATFTTDPLVTPSCVNGWSTPTAHATVSAKAEAVGVRIYAPIADAGGSWRADFDIDLSGTDPVNNIHHWAVYNDPPRPGDIIATGEGGAINWTLPVGISSLNTRLEIWYRTFDAPHTFGLTISRDRKACMPTCNEPPTTKTVNGAICVKNGCSNDVQCNPTSTPVPNPGGTNIHFENGCASVNGDPVCNWPGSKYPNTYNIKSTDPYATTTIYSNFSNTNFNPGSVQAGCKLEARWPADYADVYFDVQDGCLYDNDHNKIWDTRNCCYNPTTDQMTNPYLKKAVTVFHADNIVADHYAILSNGWITDAGALLHHEINGCVPASATSWTFYPASGGTSVDGSDANLGEFPVEFITEFDLDKFQKPGCVGRAIASAGGPTGVRYIEIEGLSWPWNLFDLLDQL